MQATIEGTKPLERAEMSKKRAVDPDDDKPKTLFAVKGTPKWYRWLVGLADSAGVSVASTIDLALKSYAKQVGYDKPMPRRPGERGE